MNPPSQRFCGNCGTALGAQAASTPAAIVRPVASTGPAPVAERRLVSILFADLVGSTTMAEGKDPEETRELLTRYFDLSRDVINRYGGTIEKFIGDAVMAVWGAPTAHEDDAERAVRAGLELVDAVKQLGPTIQARAGVLTGEAAVTLGAIGQGMVAGDLVNTASRLQSVAPPGAVLVGEATQRAASKAITFEEAGEQSLKGKTSPVPAWRAMRVVARVGGRSRAETLEAPFVGRDDEIRQLKDFFHATARDRRPRLVSVIGPAGIGKTRLAWELHKYLDGLVESIRSHDGRSPAYGEGISFWALGEMVRGRCGLLETDDEPTTRAKVAETLATHIPDPDERRWIEPALLALLGIDSGINSEQLFGAWRTFFERLAATAPVVMVFEDFHYADSGLVDFVDHLLEWSKGVPIYVVTLARPELLERRPNWGAGKRNFTSLYLDPLPAMAMHELLAGLIPGLPEPAARSIVARADGIPLYAVETVRMLLAEGRLALEGDRYVPVGDLTNLAVPETLTALIASRLDGLEPADRALISDASVLGQSFTTAGLSAVSGLGENELEPRLRTLVRRELLSLEADLRSPERGQYAFVQALIREVAYNTLARHDRKTRHLAAARFFESLGSDELAGGLAGHYLAAHANATEGPEADALAGQARISLRAAAERAAGLGAHEQASAFYEQALTVTTDPADRAELLERAGNASSTAGHHEAAKGLLRRAIAAQRELGDRAATAAVTALLARTILDAAGGLDAVVVLEPAVAEFADLGPDPAFIALEGQLARAYFLGDEHDRAIEVAERVLAAAERADLPAIVADTLVTKGTALAILGRPVEGLGAIGAGMDLAKAQGFVRTILRAYNNQAFAQATRDPRSALETSRAGVALARRLGARSWIPGLAQNIGEFAFRTGDWSTAMTEIESTLAEEFEPTDRALLLSASTPFLAARGEVVDDRLREIARLFGEGGDPQLLANREEAKAIAAFADGRLDEARAAWHDAAQAARSSLAGNLPRAGRTALWLRDAAGAGDDLAALDASGMNGPAIDASRLTLRAGLSALGGRSAEAIGLYRPALRAWRDLGLAWDEALTGMDMAMLLDPADPDVRGAAEQSREILVGLGAQPFVERLDAVLAAAGEPRSADRAPAGDRAAV